MYQNFKKYGFFTYGKTIPGLHIKGQPALYPVLNERAIRAGAGMVFALGLFSFFQAFYLNDFSYIKILVLFLVFDFSMKVIVGIRFSPVSYIANVIVSQQTPEFVPATPKRFAWGIGLTLATTMAILIFGLDVTGLPNIIICGMCLMIMFFESAFGICVGCKIYEVLLTFDMLKTYGS